MASLGESLRIAPEIRKRFDREIRLNPRAKNIAWFWKVVNSELILEKEIKFEQLDELVDEFSEIEPRFVSIAYQFTRKDGRMQCPLVMINYAPERRPMELNVLYSSSKKHAVTLLDAQYIYTLEDNEDICDEWLQDLLERSKR